MWKIFDLQRIIDELFDDVWLAAWRLDDVGSEGAPWAG